MSYNLDKLREENNGYNPEKLENHYVLLSDLGDELYIARKDEFQNDKNKYEVWIKTSAANEAEFIIHYPKTYGLVYEGHFYVNSKDF